MRDHCFQWKKT